MAIRLFPDKIMIGDFTIVETGDGLFFDGQVAADIIQETGAFQGSVAGYTSGGFAPPSSTYSNVIDKFPFASDANASDVADLSAVRGYAAGISSEVSGYTAGGYDGTSSANTIDMFYFNSAVNATNIGSIANARYLLAGHSSPSFGYVSGGYLPPPSGIDTNDIEKFSFAVMGSVTSTLVGDLSRDKESPAGHSSAVSGYSSGGYAGSLATVLSVIEKFPFATDSNATDTGSLTQARYALSGGNSSDINGYVHGGLATGPLAVNTIDKFPFSADRNATDVGDLTLARQYGAAQSSTQSGYVPGGNNTPPAGAGVNNIDKYSFAADTNATDVGDLTVIRFAAAGQQD